MKCSQEGCDRLAVGRGLCSRHYNLAYRAGALADHPTTHNEGPARFCHCEEPKPEPVVLFGRALLVDVFQCATCGRGIKENKT